MHVLASTHDTQLDEHGRHYLIDDTYVPVGHYLTHWPVTLFNTYPCWHWVQLDVDGDVAAMHTLQYYRHGTH